MDGKGERPGWNVVAFECNVKRELAGLLIGTWLPDCTCRGVVAAPVSGVLEVDTVANGNFGSPRFVWRFWMWACR